MYVAKANSKETLWWIHSEVQKTFQLSVNVDYGLFRLTSVDGGAFPLQ